MQKIENILTNLLATHNCVVLPGFGAFLAEREGAWIHPVTQRFYPPKKRIAFNAQLVLNDGVLQTHLSLALGISSEIALQKVNEYVQHLTNELKTQKSVSFPGIGRCYFNQSEQLEFEPDSDLNLLEESFGLTEVFFKPLDTTTIMSQRPVRPVVRRPGTTTTTSSNETPPPESKNSKPEKKPAGSGAGKVVLILIPLFLLIGAGGTLFYLKQNGRSFASMNPFEQEIKKENPELPKASETEVKQDTVVSEYSSDTSSTEPETSTEYSNEITTVVTEAPSKSTLAEKQEELSKKEATKKEGVGTSVAQHGRYFVVVGSFIDRQNAINLRNKMAARGLNVTLIEKTKDSRFYKVAIDDFESEEEAIRRKKELQGQFGGEVWVMSY
jgi:nucleoid DNA-binding protein/cell division septation protein DedD